MLDGFDPDAANTAPITPGDAARVLQFRRDVRRDFGLWCDYALGKVGLKPAAHHRFLIRELQAVAEGRTQRLIVSLPPGSGKSSFTSDLFPAWLAGHRPGVQIIGSSNTASLAKNFSRKVQDRLREDHLTLGVGLASEAADLWHTTEGGQYRAVGVGGALTGFRGDCVTGDTLVQTPNGFVRIDSIPDFSKPCYVLSYDIHTARSEFRRVVAVRRSRTASIWRLHSAAGRMVETTGDHRVRTQAGWTPTQAINVHDVLVCAMREPGDGFICTRGQEDQKDRARCVVLRKGVCDASEQCSPRDARVFGVSELSRSIDSPALWGSGYLFGSVRDRATGQSFPDQGAKLQTLFEGYSRATLRDVQASFPAPISFVQTPVLLEIVREHRARSGDCRVEQPGVARRSERIADGAVSGKSYPGQGADKRRVPVCGVRRFGPDTNASHQLEQFGSPSRELGYTLSHVPHTVARWGTVQTESDRVSLVENIRRECDVWDIQVEGTNCFFANGILVHNCILVDDPVKDRAQAESPTIREKTWEWFTSVLTTRLKPGGAIIVVATRWHPSDLMGRLLDRQRDDWKYICIPAIAGPDDPLGRPVGGYLWDDDAYGYGKLLRKFEKSYTESGALRDWQALFQQDPRPGEGGLFKVTKIEVLDAVPHEMTFPVRAWDLASTKQMGTTDPDWTVGVKMSRLGPGRFMVHDVVRLRGGPHEVLQAIKNTASQDGYETRIGIPQDPGQAGVAQVSHITGELMGYTVEAGRETGDKATRANPFASQVNAGNVFMVRGEWSRVYLDELRDFPSGVHDDMVDASSRAFQMLGGDDSLDILAMMGRNR